MRALASDLRRGLSELALPISDHQVSQLLDYLALIQKWTQVYNLTAVREPQAMLTQHLLDSLAVVKPLIAQTETLRLSRAAEGRPLTLLDVGSGAGLPGVVLAICQPAWQVHCVDAVAKKTAFIQQVAANLGLPNLSGVHARVESLKGPFDVICSRAFASLTDFTAWSRAALLDGGLWMAMKGKAPTDEMKALPNEVQVFHVEPVVVPGLDADRCIVWMRRA